MLVDWLEDEYQNQVLAGADDAARDQGMNLICFPGGVLDSKQRFGQHRNFIYELATPRSVDALIVVAGTLANQVGPERLLAYCQRFQPLPMCTVSVPLPGIPSVTVDNASGLREAVTNLVTQRSLRSIAFISGPLANQESQLRHAVFRSVLEQFGVTWDPHLVVAGDFTRPSGAAAVRELLDRRHASFQAIVAANDYMALGAMQELLSRGVRVPEQVAIIGFDDVAEARFAPVPLSTVRQPMYRVGRCAFELVHEQLCGRHPQERVELRTEHVTRRSCGARRAHPSTVPVQLGATSLTAALNARRHVVLERLRSSVANAEDVVARLEAACSDGSVYEFADWVSRVAEHAAARGEDTAVWDSVIDALCDELASYGDVPEALAFADRLRKLTRVRMLELGHRIEGQRVLQMRRQLHAMRHLGEGLLTALDTRQIMQLVASELPDLDIRACYVALFDGQPGQAPESVLRWERERPEPELVPRRFPAEELVPDRAQFTSRRRSCIVEPLYFEDERLGFAVCEMGPREGMVYETLREQISSALKRGRLVYELLEQSALRQRAEQQRLHKEVEIAKVIQTTVLPRRFNVRGLEIAAQMIPASEVGGDYYDVIPAGSGCFIGIGDVAGHGLRTGLVMLMIQSTIAGVTRFDPNATPSSVVRAINQALYENVRNRLLQDEHATLTLIRYAPDGGLVFAGGHEELLIRRAATGRVELVPTPGPWVGAVPNLGSALVDSSIQLEDGDLLVLFTDGVIEAKNPAGQQYGLERFERLIAEIGGQAPDAIRERIIDCVTEWCPVLDDDVTVLVARYSARAAQAAP
jgi:DNA-binding LacI/PurR family transcriptional regulator/serine phosphatase RsbU (regulator of sigma subunit)